MSIDQIIKTYGDKQMVQDLQKGLGEDPMAFGIKISFTDDPVLYLPSDKPWGHFGNTGLQIWVSALSHLVAVRCKMTLLRTQKKQLMTLEPADRAHRKTNRKQCHSCVIGGKRECTLLPILMSKGRGTT
jgi:hypothetical protein